MASEGIAMSNEEGSDIEADSFWEIGNFRRAVKRCDDGFELCTKLSHLIQERSEIEKNYAASLQRWSQKWHGFLEKGPEYGTMKCAWDGFTEEAAALAEVHNRIRSDLVNSVQASVKAWQKENYSKTTLPPQRLKNSKEFEDRFLRAQKTWGRQYKSVQDNRKAYHNACKQERSLKLQLQNTKNDPSSQADQVRKLEEKVKRAERDVDRTETQYRNSITDIEGMNPGYMRNMSEVFADCQSFEEKRLVFFKEVLKNLHSALDVSHDPKLPEIYTNLDSTVQHADAHQDLRWWSQHNGEDMPMMWPQFENYVPELKQTISKSRKSGSNLATDDGVRLRAISSSHGGSIRGAASVAQESAAASAAAAAPAAAAAYARSAPHENSPRAANVEGDAALDDADRPGVPVRALYDYAPAEDDELSFEKGDEFEKLDDEDEQGWCKGRKGGKVGLYPANYAEPI